MSQVQTALSNTTLSGYVDTSAVFNPGGSRNGLYGIIGYIRQNMLIIASTRRWLQPERH